MAAKIGGVSFSSFWEMSMKEIWKFPCSAVYKNEIKMPEGARFLHAGLDPQNTLCVWMLVDPTAPPEIRHFYSYGTGWDVDPGQQYLATVNVGQYMWHLFEDAR